MTPWWQVVTELAVALSRWAWPLLVLLLVLYFRLPLREILTQVGALLGRVTRLRTTGVDIEVLGPEAPRLPLRFEDPPPLLANVESGASEFSEVIEDKLVDWAMPRLGVDERDVRRRVYVISPSLSADLDGGRAYLSASVVGAEQLIGVLALPVIDSPLMLPLLQSVIAAYLHGARLVLGDSSNRVLAIVCLKWNLENEQFDDILRETEEAFRPAVRAGRLRLLRITEEEFLRWIRHDAAPLNKPGVHEPKG